MNRSTNFWSTVRPLSAVWNRAGRRHFQLGVRHSQLHGDVFEILRNQFSFPTDFFPSVSRPTEPTTPIQPAEQLRFTVGGPVIIPKLYTERIVHFSITVRTGLSRIRLRLRWTVADRCYESGDFSVFSIPRPRFHLDPLTGQPFPATSFPSRYQSTRASVLPASLIRIVRSGLWPAKQ